MFADGYAPRQSLAHWQVTIFQIPLFVIGALAIILAASVWRQRGKPGAIATGMMMICLALWSLAYGVELGSDDLATRLFLTKIQYIGIALLPLAWYLFARRFSIVQTRLSGTQIAILLIIPLLTILLAWTNEWHHLLSYGATLDDSGPVTRIAKHYGAWFWVHTAYSYLLLLLGSTRLVRTMLQNHRLYRAQTGWVIIGALAPWVANVLYLLLPLHAFPIDPTPALFSVSCFAVFWGIFRLKLFDLVPAAHAVVIASMPEGLIVLDSDCRIVSMNPAAEEILSCRVDQVIGRRPDDISLFPEVLGNWLCAEATNASQIAPLSTQPGKLYAWQRHPLLSGDEPTGYLLLLRDITEQERSRQHLLQHVARMETLCDAINVGVIVRDSEGRIQLANRQFCEMFALPPFKDCEMASWVALTDEAQKRLLRAPESVEANMLRQIELAGQAATQELELTDGRLVTCDVVPIRVTDGGGGQVWLYRDVTAQRRYEKRLHHIETMESLARLAGGVAHDFNNLLTGIFGYVDLMMTEPDFPPAFLPDLAIIREQGDRAATLVRQILDYSRRSSSEKLPLDLELFVPEVLAFLRQMLPENVVLAVKPEPSSRGYWVAGDLTQLQQMITNLAINAADAMPDGRRHRYPAAAFVHRRGGARAPAQYDSRGVDHALDT